MRDDDEPLHPPGTTLCGGCYQPIPRPRAIRSAPCAGCGAVSIVADCWHPEAEEKPLCWANDRGERWPCELGDLLGEKCEAETFYQLDVPYFEREDVGLEQILRRRLRRLYAPDGDPTFDLAFIRYRIEPPAITPEDAIRDGTTHEGTLFAILQLTTYAGEGHERRVTDIVEQEVPLSKIALLHRGHLVVHGALLRIGRYAHHRRWDRAMRRIARDVQRRFDGEDVAGLDPHALVHGRP